MLDVTGRSNGKNGRGRMSGKSVLIGDFYHELGMMTRAGLPLPEALRQLARDMRSVGLGMAIEALGDEAERGRSLSQAMDRFPRQFPVFHRRLIEAGEARGVLADALFAVSRFSYFQYHLIAQLRQVFLYPALTTLAALAVMLLMGVFVIPDFAMIYDEMLAGEPLPGLTTLVLAVSEIIVRLAPLFVVLFVLAIGMTVWLLVGGRRAVRFLSRFVSFLPGAWRITESMDSARVCSFLGTFLAQQQALLDALRTTAHLVQLNRVRDALLQAADAHEAGKSLPEVLEKFPAIDRLIVFAFRQTPEAELSEELVRLAGIYERRALLATRSTVAVWEIIAIIVMSLTVGLTILSLFLPLIRLINVLGG